jgi:hypothetical protein
MPNTTSIFIGSRFAGVSARNNRFPKLNEIAACRYLFDLPAISRRGGRIAAALAAVPRIKGGGYEVGRDQDFNPEGKQAVLPQSAAEAAAGAA